MVNYIHHLVTNFVLSVISSWPASVLWDYQSSVSDSANRAEHGLVARNLKTISCECTEESVHMMMFCVFILTAIQFEKILKPKALNDSQWCIF